MVRPMTKTVLTRKAIELAAAIAAGIGLWRFTSGHWLSGIVFVALVGAVIAWYAWNARRPRDTRRY
jgi:membrane protein implicated in regulation of membrane protease activity